VNPQSTVNHANVRFLREGAENVAKHFRLEPHARLTVDVGSYPELAGSAFGIEVAFIEPGVAERAQYFGLDPLWKGGHESAGVTAPAKEWMLAEGATGPFFETFVLVANPTNQQAELKMTYLTTGTPVVRTKTLAPNSRLTVNIEYEDPTLENAAVATKVESTVPVVVERAQYWPYTPDQWYEGHASAGVTEAFQTHWGLAEGRVGGPEAWQTYILVANSNPNGDATVTMRFFRDNGTPVTKQFLVKANSRFNVAVGSDQVPEITSGAFAVDITSDWPIVVERAMYSDVNGQVWGAGTNATATKMQ
jgi:hypothetical protein